MFVWDVILGCQQMFHKNEYTYMKDMNLGLIIPVIQQLKQLFHAWEFNVMKLI